MALIGNIAPLELIVIAALAVIIFGKRLPEVAARTYGHFRRFRTTLDDFRRETGIDRELRDIDYTVRNAARKAATKQLPPPPKTSGPDDDDQEEAAEPTPVEDSSESGTIERDGEIERPDR